MTKLLRSKDRKVANLVTKNGKQASIANTFGLPAGKAYSCPGATSICESVCYAGKLEKVFPTVKKIYCITGNYYAMQTSTQCRLCYQI
jgi:hypothetical protein